MKRNCLMVQIASDAFYEAQRLIDPADVVEYEHNPHVTILAGIDPTTPFADVREVVDRLNPKDAVSRSLTYFSKPEYDVVKFDLNDPSVFKLNEVALTLPNESDYPNFTPHVTVAYVKSGTGKKYARRLESLALFRPQGVHYSTASGENHYWPLRSQRTLSDFLIDPVSEYYRKEHGIDISAYDFSEEPEDLTPPTDDNPLTVEWLTRHDFTFFELMQLLRGDNAVELIYSEVTKPGTIATRLATLNPTFVNRVYNFKGADVPRPPGLRRYIDLTAKGWRSFYYGRVISYRLTSIPLSTIPFPPIN